MQLACRAIWLNDARLMFWALASIPFLRAPCSGSPRGQMANTHKTEQTTRPSGVHCSKLEGKCMRLACGACCGVDFPDFAPLSGVAVARPTAGAIGAHVMASIRSKASAAAALPPHCTGPCSGRHTSGLAAQLCNSEEYACKRAHPTGRDIACAKPCHCQSLRSCKVLALESSLRASVFRIPVVHTICVSTVEHGWPDEIQLRMGLA